MNLRKKFRAMVIFWFLAGFGLLVAAVELSSYYLAGLLLIAAVVAGYMMNLKCPACGKRVLYKPITVFGITIPFWISWIPKQCSKCGAPL